MSWTLTSSPFDGSGAGINGACWAVDRGEFVAVGSDPAGTKVILRSADGISWAYEASPLDGVSSGLAVTRSAALGLYVAVGVTSIVTSPDGAAWTDRGNPFTGGETLCVACKPSTGLVIVGGGFGSAQSIALSSDGLVYVPVSSPFDGRDAFVEGIAYSPGTDRWLAVGVDNSSVPAVAYSDNDGATWAVLVSPAGVPNGVYRDEGAGNWWIFGGSGFLQVSADNGATWTDISSPLDGGILAMVAIGGGVMGLGGFDSASDNQLCTSADSGSTWSFDFDPHVFGTGGSGGEALTFAYSPTLTRAVVGGSPFLTKPLAYGLPGTSGIGTKTQTAIARLKPGGLTIDFTDSSRPGPSGPITDWLWRFGDGHTSSEQNPTHTYSGTGLYGVTLIVTGTSPDGTDKIHHGVVVT